MEPKKVLQLATRKNIIICTIPVRRGHLLPWKDTRKKEEITVRELSDL